MSNVRSQTRREIPSELQVDERLKDQWPAEKGLRKVLRKITGFNVPPGAAELEERKEKRMLIEKKKADHFNDTFLTSRIRRDKTRTVYNGVETCGFLSVMSEKGGVGKTTVASLLSMVLSNERPREDIAVVDLNPDRGSLASRMSVNTAHSIRDVMNASAQIMTGQASVRDFMVQAPHHRVWVLPGDTTPERRESTLGDEVRKIFQMFAYNFSIAVLDNGTGISHSAMEGNLSVSHGMALVVENTNDAYTFIDSTLERLEALNYTDLRNRIVLVINEKVFLPPELVEDSVNSKFSVVTGQDIAEAYKGRVSNTIVIPFDPTLARSGPISFQALLPETVTQVKRLAATMMDDLVVRE